MASSLLREYRVRREGRRAAVSTKNCQFGHAKKGRDVKKVAKLEAGFTLVELMVVVAIIGVISAFALSESSTERNRRAVSNGRKMMTNTLMTARQEAYALGRPVAVHIGSRKIETFLWKDIDGDGELDVPNESDEFSDGFGEVERLIRRASLDRGDPLYRTIKLTEGIAGGPSELGGCNDLDGNRSRFVVFRPAGFLTNGNGVPCMFVRLYVQHLQDPTIWGMIDVLPTGQAESFDAF